MDTTSEHKNNVPHLTNGYNQFNVYDWLAEIPLPPNQQPFNIVEIKFKSGRKDFYLKPENISLKQTDIVIVETNGGRIAFNGNAVGAFAKKCL